jgi:hypothetical protein
MDLNHYIGMKPIVPESIPELRWMPWILGGLMAGGCSWRRSAAGSPLYRLGGAPSACC